MPPSTAARIANLHNAFAGPVFRTEVADSPRRTRERPSEWAYDDLVIPGVSPGWKRDVGQDRGFFSKMATDLEGLHNDATDRIIVATALLTGRAI